MAQKMVNGELVDLTPQEDARRQAEDAAFENSKGAPRAGYPVLEEVYAALKDKLAGKPGADAALAAIDAKFESVKADKALKP